MEEMHNIYTMFHGTSSVNLDSILHNGLLANPSKRSWSDHSAACLDIPSMKALDGVYLASDIITASDSAARSVKLFGGSIMCVVCEIDPDHASVDEDNIW